MKLRAAALLCAALAALHCGGNERRLAEARSLQQAGDFAASIAGLETLLGEDPDHAEANYLLGVAFAQTGEPSRAVWPLEKAAEAGDYQLDAGVLLASTHLLTRSYDEAIRAAGRVLAIDADDDAALRVRAHASLGARRLEAALADTSRLAERFPSDYGVASLHAAVLADLGRLEEAEREHLRLRQLGEAGDDPDLRDRSCLAPGIFAQDVLGDAERARAFYEECAALGPTHVVALQHLAGFFDSVGETERGTALWRDAVTAAPDRLELHQGLASRLEALGESADAQQVLRDSIDRFGSAAAWQGLVHYHRLRRESGSALEALEHAIEIAGSEGALARFVRADLLIDLGRLDQARELTEQLDHETYAHLLRGRIELERGRPGPALEHFDRGLIAWPSNASARFLAGLAARELGDTERAISELREAVRADNSETDAALELARLLLERGDDLQALGFARMALRGRNGALRREPYEIAARALLRLGQPEPARSWIQRLQALGFEDAALAARSELRRREGDLEGALQDLDLAYAAAPDEASYAYAATQLLAAAGRGAEAERRLREIVGKHPTAAAARNDLAWLLAERGEELDLALSLSREAQRLEPSPNAEDTLGWVHYRRGDFDLALAAFERSVAAEPGAPAVWYRLGLTLVERGEAARARESFERALEAGPFPEADEARQRLAGLAP